MYQPTVDLLNSLSQEKQTALVEILKDKAKLPQDANLTLKELLILNYGADEVEVYNSLVDEIDMM